MSGEMRGFAAHFMQGLALGSSWAEKWQNQQIAKERNRLKGQQDALRNAREEKKLGLYGQSVAASSDLARARAYRALNPVAKGGGGGGGGGASTPADVTGLLREANQMGIISSPPQQQQGGSVTNNYLSSDEGSGDSPVPQMPAAEPVELRRGGMIRKMAGGGSIEQGATMTLDQAMSYGDKPKASSGSAFASAAAAAASKYKPKDKETPKPDTVTPTGPQGSGPGGSYTTADTATPTGPQGSGEGGSYTTADTQPGGVLDTGYRRGGRVRRYADGGSVGDLTQDPAALAAARTPPPPPAPTTRYDESSSGGGAATGEAGTGQGGVGGAGADAGSDGSAAAGTSGDAGSDGGGTYRRGGRVRQFQSGGRVMRAIDTGTSGPGSGYGYRAPPPARSY